MNTTALAEFKKLSAVPRRSDHCEKIIDYCLARAKELGLETYFDEKNLNVLVRKKAACGKENRPGVILQGHLDMVAQQDAGVVHDWENDGLELIEEGDFITANGTTLGADNGSAIALAFALMADESLQNPPLEALFTTNEEVGMDSVKDADLHFLQGEYLFNLDGGGEGSFVTGCCGGHTVCVWTDAKKEAANGAAYRLTVTGLNGGHSGIEIGTERANALKIMGKVLYETGKTFAYRIVDLTAEGKDNAISKEAVCEIILEEDHAFTDLLAVVKNTEKQLKHIYRQTDADLEVKLEALDTCPCAAGACLANEAAEAQSVLALPREKTKALVALLMHLPFGVLHRDQSNLDFIETSCNLGFVAKREDGLGIVLSIRSSVAERIDEVFEQIVSIASVCGAAVEEDGKAYPAWLPDPASPLIPIFGDMYRKMYGKEPSIGPVHAGLECGYILKNSDVKAAISTGPQVYGEHTTKEKMSISSLERTYAFIKAVIESI